MTTQRIAGTSTGPDVLGARRPGRPSTSLERTCVAPGCGTVFRSKPSEVARGGGLYCSAACRVAAISERSNDVARDGMPSPPDAGIWTEKTCENADCRKLFRFRKSEARSLVFGARRHCSRACRVTAEHARERRGRQPGQRHPGQEDDNNSC
jgi:hypothetical protein